MENEFEDYRAFDSIETARFVLLDLLEANNIPYKIYKDPYRQDVILGRGIDLIDLWVRIHPEDFERVNELMLHSAEERYAEVPPDYYLRELDTTDLLDVLKKPDMWSIDDFVVARKLLEERGIPVSPDKIGAWADERQKQLEHEKWGETRGAQVDTKVSGILKGMGSSTNVLDYETDKKPVRKFGPNFFNYKTRLYLQVIILVIMIIVIAIIKAIDN